MTNIVSLYRQLFGRNGPANGSVIDMAEHGREGGISTGQGYKYVKTVPEPSLIDEASSTVTYVGTCKQGSTADTSSAIWQIKKISVSGTVTTISFADGDDNYDNIWDNRASLSYS